MSCKTELLSFLRGKPKEITAVVMPDFFLDRLIDLDCTPKNFCSQVKAVARRKGGSIDGVNQNDIRGGNAVNTASALAALGVDAIPIVCTDQLGLQQLRFHLDRYHVDTSHVKVLAKASITTALELKTDTGKANVMLRDLGSLANFGPENLTENDYRLIEEADYICVFNWAGTKNHGTELARTIFKRTKTRGKGKTYYDTADPTPNKEDIPELMEKVLKTAQIDVLSLNENEAITYARHLASDAISEKRKTGFSEQALESARVLAKRLSARIDLHTTGFSATFTGKSEVAVPAFKIKPLRATGAGDAWNAGNILGDGNGLSDECRLTLANAVSASYLSYPEAMHPTKQMLSKFLESIDFE